MLHNNAQMSVTGTPGTGAITLNAAVTGYTTFALAGVKNGETVSYSIIDGSNWEVGRGVHSAGTLTRGPLFSSNSNAAISATSGATVAVDQLSEDLPHFDAHAAFPLVADFTVTNPGTTVLTDTPVGMNIAPPPSGGTSFTLLTKSVPSFPFDFYARFNYDLPTIGYAAFGLCLRNSTNGRWLNMGYYFNAVGTYGFLFQRFNSPTSYNADIATGFAFAFGKALWLRGRVTSTAVAFDASFDGYSWRQPLAVSENFSTFITAAGGAVDQMGVYVQTPDDGVTAANATLNFFDTNAPV